MSDLVAQFGLDDRAFDAGLQRAERRAVTSAQRIFTQTSQVAGREARRQEEFARKIQTAYTKGWAAVEKGITSVAAAGALVARSVTEYGERFSYARGQVEEMNAAIDRFKTSLGRDLSGAGGGNMLADIVDWAGKAREAISDVTAAAVNFWTLGLVGNSATEILQVNDERRRMEAMDVFAGRASRASDARLELDIRAARAAGDEQRVVELTIQQRKREANRRLAGMDILGGDRDELRRLEYAVIEQEERGRLTERRRDRADTSDDRRYRAESGIADRLDELRAMSEADAARARGQDRVAAGIEFEQRLERRVASLRQGGAGEEMIQRLVGAEREAFARESDAERRRAEELRAERAAGLDHARQMLEVERLRWQGQSTEADVLRAQLEYRRLIAEVQADELLTIEQKAEYTRMYEEAMDGEVAFLKRQGRSVSARSLPVGLTSRVHLAHAFGPGAGVDLPRKQLDVAEKQLAVLHEISEKSGVYA